MSMDLDPVQAAPLERRDKLVAHIRRHELLTFFLTAYTFPWLIWIPFLVLSQNGLGLLPFKAPALLLAIIGGFGPGIAGIIVTGVTEGRSGVGRLLQRCIKWKAGIQWYLLVVFLVPSGFLLASVLLGEIGYGAILQKSSLLVGFYPVVLVAGYPGRRPR